MSERSFKHPVERSFVVGLDVLGLPAAVLRGVTRVCNMKYTSEEIQSLGNGPLTCLSIINVINDDYCVNSCQQIPFFSDLKIKEPRDLSSFTDVRNQVIDLSRFLLGFF